METQDLVKGRLDFTPSRDAGAEPTAPGGDARATSYRASRLGLEPERQPGEPRSLRPHSRGARRLKAVRRSARLGWTAAAALVIACGIGSYYFTAKVIYAFSDKLDNVSGQVQSHVATIGKLEGERAVLSVSLNATRARLSQTRQKLDDIKTEHSRIGAKLDASIAKLMDAMRERDRARKTADSVLVESSKVKTQLEFFQRRMRELAAERQRLITKQEKLLEALTKDGRVVVQQEPTALDRIWHKFRSQTAGVIDIFRTPTRPEGDTPPSEDDNSTPQVEPEDNTPPAQPAGQD